MGKGCQGDIKRIGFICKASTNRAEEGTLDKRLEGDKGIPNIGCKGESSIPIS